jgi:hypothetical protein
MKRSQHLHWVHKNKKEIKQCNIILEGIVQKPQMSNYFSQNMLLAVPMFYEMTDENFPSAFC